MKPEDVSIQDYVDYQGLEYRETAGTSGDQLNLRECPACGNANWKVYLNADTGFGNCFVCDTTFNRWTFIADCLGTREKGAVRQHLNDIRRALGFRPAQKKKMAVYTEVDGATLPLSLPLPTNKGNHPYLENRGINGDYAKRFHLRICKYGYHKFERDGKERFQHFDNRIIIPVLDMEGELVTFQGRDVTGTAENKYLFPAQLPATGRYLYNGYEALTRRSKEIIMCEGAFDVIPTAIVCDAFPEMNDITVVGSFGKHLSSSKDEKASQVDALRRLKRDAGLTTVTIMWDGEKSALVAALDAAKIITGLGLAVRIALLPAGKDPNEVDARIVYESWRDAVKYTRLNDVRLRTKNPYS